MKTIKYLIAFPVIALCAALSFCACSDDDSNDKDPVNNGGIDPTTVFTGKRIGNINGSSMVYDQNGLLTRISNSEETVTFSYQDATRSAGTRVKMTISYPQYPEEGDMYIDMVIGKNGFVESATETYEKDDDIDTWAFGYNNEGHLNYMKRSEGGNEITNITYEHGNIVKVAMNAQTENAKLNASISYHSTPIENKGCIMLFDATFGIDMDEMKYAYWAGLLGKATQNLPSSYTDDETTRTFVWDINNEGYPLSMTYKDGEYTEQYNFNW